MSDVTPHPAAWHASVITLFPELFPGPLAASLIGRAADKGLWGLDVIDLKDFAPADQPSHHIDSPPSGGGAGMVLRADIAAAAIDAAQKKDDPRPLIYLTPSGHRLTQDKVAQFAQERGLVILCGRYEGVDQRVLDARGAEEISIGDFVLAGGETAAMVLLEAIIRLLPGVVGTAASLQEESFAAGLLEYPHYTRPREWEGRAIPEVLLSGDHAAIRSWRRARAQSRTETRRPDLIKKLQQKN